MKKGLKFLTILGLCGLSTALIACADAKNDPTATPTETPSVDVPTDSKPAPSESVKPSEDNKVDYTVTVKSKSGRPVQNAYVSFYDGDKFLKQVATDDEGKAAYHTEKGEYTVEVETPEGYYLSINRQKTSLANLNLEFVCEPMLIEDIAPAETIYGLGDQMYDFTVVEYSGDERIEYNLSDLLQTKRMVVLNFWYSGCSNCLAEFPVINDVYKMNDSKGNPYTDNMEFLAINPILASESPETPKFIEKFKADEGYAFPMVADYNIKNNKQYEDNVDYFPALNSFFKIGGYPTTIVIDKFGTIAKIITGGIDDPDMWKNLFEAYTSDDYEQEYVPGEDENPDGFIKNSAEHPDYDKVATAVSGTNYNGKPFVGKFSKETSPVDEPYAWPWQISADGRSIVASNLGRDRTYSIIYLTVELKKDEVLTFDALYNTDKKDQLIVVVDDIPLNPISGASKNNEPETHYTFPAQYDDEYKIGFLYMKDQLGSAINENVALSNFRIENTEVYKEDTYVYREASSGEYSDFDGKFENYITPVFNEADGYYHVGAKNGPLLMANLLSPTHFHREASLYQMVAADPKTFIIDGVDYGAVIEEYAVYTSDSLVGYMPVTKELKDTLVAIAKRIGSEESKGNENQWLEMCVYFDVYGPTKVQMSSPVKGLVPWEAFEMNYETQSADILYDRVITNRGYLVRFVPTKSGVYKFTSQTDMKLGGTDLLICDENLNVIGMNDRFTREQTIRFDNFENKPIKDVETANFISYFYYEAGKTYYLKPHFLEAERMSGNMLSFKYEYMGVNAEIVTAAAEEMFTTDSEDADLSDPNLEEHIVSRSYIDIELQDGFYVVKDSKAKDKYIYFDIQQSLSLFDGLTFDELMYVYAYNEQTEKYEAKRDENGNKIPTLAFDFRYDEFSTLRVNSQNQVLKTQKDKDGFDMFDENGKTLYTNEIKLDKTKKPYVVRDARDEIALLVTDPDLVVNSTDPNMKGLVRVNAELAEILQMLMDKYTFMGVENSWLKVCYYANYLGK